MENTSAQTSMKGARTAHADEHLVRVLDVGHVGGQPGDQAGCEKLSMLVNGSPEFYRTYPCAGFSRNPPRTTAA